MNYRATFLNLQQSGAVAKLGVLLTLRRASAACSCPQGYARAEAHSLYEEINRV